MSEKKNLPDQLVHQQDPQATSEEHNIRVAKIETMRSSNIEPWPKAYAVNATCAQVHEEFENRKESFVYQVAGRLMTKREHGKTIFGTIQDRSGSLQIYIRKDDIGEVEFSQFQHLVDIGDIVWVTGTSFRTKTGEVTVKATQYQGLSKCLYPLPDKFHGLADVETKYRQRYLDLISNVESRERFKKRSLIISTLRHFLEEHDALEVETPMLHSIPGGAAARPFVTHHNALDMQLYLRIAPELYLKRLVIGGLERVYEINRCFRNEGLSTRHNPEFTTLELYVAHHDYVWMMDFAESMIRRIANAVCDDITKVQFGEHTVNLAAPFRRLPMKDAVKEYIGCSEQDLSENNIDTLLSRHSITLEKKNASWGEKLYALFDKLVESKLIQPTFITQFPVEVSPLAKRNFENPLLVDRFELFIVGLEFANAFNELNDPFDQAKRFHEQAAQLHAGDVEAHHYDADFIHALEYGLPPTVGYGMGIDRLTMLLTNTTSIRDVILFPTLKQKS